MSEYGGYSRMLSQHLGKCLTEEQHARWVELLLQSAREGCCTRLHCGRAESARS